MLQGATPAQRVQVLAAYHKTMRKPDALLGHEGRWYETPAPAATHPIPGTHAVAGETVRDEDADMAKDTYQ